MTSVVDCHYILLSLVGEDFNVVFKRVDARTATYNVESWPVIAQRFIKERNIIKLVA